MRGDAALRPCHRPQPPRAQPTAPSVAGSSLVCEWPPRRGGRRPWRGSVSKAGCQPHAKTPPRHRAPHCTWVGRADYRNGTTSRRSSRSRSSSGWTRCAGGTRGKSGGPAKGTLGSAPFLTRRCTAKATKRTISIAKSSHAQAKVLLLPHIGATLGSEHASARRCQLRLSASSFG